MHVALAIILEHATYTHTRAELWRQLDPRAMESIHYRLGLERTELSGECSRMQSTNWGLHTRADTQNARLLILCDQIAINHIHLSDKIDKCSHTFARTQSMCLVFCFSFISALHRCVCVHGWRLAY